MMDGERPPEYKVEMNGTDEITCHVPSQTGKVSGQLTGTSRVSDSFV